jgi:Holliday junction resolvase RusA-like endonuclease
MHVEFVIVGVPISNQSAGSAALLAWRASIEAEVRTNWKYRPLTGKLKAVIINFHLGEKPSVDLDNMSKPILDVMQKIVYENDRQITQAEFTHVRIDAPFVIVGASKLIVSAVQAGAEFVYVRVEDPLDPFPLPK